MPRNFAAAQRGRLHGCLGIAPATGNADAMLRHEKRWEDVEELLDADIDVITSLNVQPVDRLGEATNRPTP